MSVKVEFNPSVKQDKAWDYLNDKTTLYVGYGGSAFSGKSYLLCYWLTIGCIAYPGTSWGLGRKELITLKKTTLITLFKVFKESNIRAGSHYNYNQQLNTVTFWNGSVIYLIDMAFKPSDEHYQRFGGYELTGAAVDESAEVQGLAIETLFTRCGRMLNSKYNLCGKLLETFNPAKNHVYRKYYKPFKEHEEKQDVKFVPALPQDNPSPEVDNYVKNIISTASKVTIERLIYGNFEYDDDPAVLIDNDSIVNYFNPTHLKQEGQKYMTIDVARKGKDKTIFRIWIGWVCISRFHIPKSGIDEVVKVGKELQLKHAVPISNVIADEDGVGGGVIDFMKCKGFINNSRPVNGENYDNLKSQCSIKMAKKIVAKEVGEICDDHIVIETTSEEMEQVKIKDIDKDGKQGIVPKDKVKELIGRSPDEWDSIMMRYWFELNPKASFDIR